jgi:putative tryptophan/tyrosine transport system substrate-binding protein
MSASGQSRLNEGTAPCPLPRRTSLTGRLPRDILPHIAANMTPRGPGQMAIGVGRRHFIFGFVGAAAWPLAVRAQQSALPVIGWLSSGSAQDPHFAGLLTDFRAGLKDAGYVEDRNVEIDFRWSEGQYARLPALAAELVGKRVAVIVAGGPPAAVAAKAATETIPIVFTVGDDPVKLGLVASLNRPGGNATGINLIDNDLEAKRLGLLREVVPAANTIGVLLNPASPAFDTQSKGLQAGAHASGVEIVILTAASQQDIDQAFSTLGRMQAGALLVGSDPFLSSFLEQLVTLAARQSLPTMFAQREAVEIGGLMSYSIGFAEAYREAGVYAGQILKGEKPDELPVVRATKFDLVINLKTAKTLGLTLSPGLLSIADEVIE